MTGSLCASRDARGVRSTGAFEGATNGTEALRKEPSKRAARAGSRWAIVEGAGVGCSPRLGLVVMVSLGLSEEVRAYAIVRKKGLRYDGKSRMTWIATSG